MDCTSLSFWLFSAIFVIGYLMITLEHFLRIDKAAIALLMATIMWGILINESCRTEEASLAMLRDHFSGVAQIIFFLLGALAIVEVMNAHRGFKLINLFCRVRSKHKLLWIMSLVTFFLSSILDNLTTTVVMVTLLKQLIQPGEDRKIIGGGIVIAANAGGAWTPIGDVTTTMLWIGGQVSTGAIMYSLLLPSLTCLCLAILLLSKNLQGRLELQTPSLKESQEVVRRGLVLTVGILALICVPIYKVLFGLPPFMGILCGLSILWILVDHLYDLDEKKLHLKMLSVFQKIDYGSLFFFCGILLAVNALESGGVLQAMAYWLDGYVSNMHLTAIIIGLVSAVIDNVPLVAASMGMYSLQGYPADISFWHLIAYCAGTGGSILLIGSAAGVVYMGMEKVSFGWYLRRIAAPAALGYFGGVGVYFLMGAP